MAILTGRMHDVTSAADPGRPRGPHNRVAQQFSPKNNVRVHVGPVLPHAPGTYGFPWHGHERSRAGYHVVDRMPSGPQTLAMPDAATYLSWATRAFRSRRYREAMRLAQHAIIEDVRDGKLYLLLSQTQFAIAEYEAAAESLRYGLSLLDPTEWGHVAGNRRRFYVNGDYERQLRGLTVFVDDHPDATYARFLRGYHGVFAGQEDVAKEDLLKAAGSSQYANLALSLLAMVDDVPPSNRFEELPPPIGTQDR